MDARTAHQLHDFLIAGNALLASNRPAEAINAYRQALLLDSNLAEVWNNLGNAFGDVGRHDEAIEAYRSAIGINPLLDRAHGNLGLALRENNRLAEAIVELEKAIELNPNSSANWDNLGIALRELGELNRALAAHEKATSLDPSSAIAHNNFSIALRAAGRLDEAIAAARAAITLQGDYAEAHNNLGVALADNGLADEAIDAYRTAIRLKPNYADAYTNIGASLADKGDFAGSLALCRKAVEIDPGNADAHFNLAISLLLSGDFQGGWEEYEWRWKCRGLLPARQFVRPRWEGGELNGRTILIHAEQGLGDAIMFVRYIPLIAQLGGKIVLECQPELVQLFGRIPGVKTVVPSGTRLPDFDVHCPIASLPRALKTTLKSIPGRTPYIEVDLQLVEKWRRRLDSHLSVSGARNQKVGVAWAGNSANKNDRNRSLHLNQLQSLFALPITFVSLQRGPAASQLAETPADFRVMDFAADLTDFAETAALIANLDLVISVDTAVAHLAGAMGKPVWVMVPFNPDWRWLVDREDSPWYPTMRLFRQKAIGDWDEVVERIERELKMLCRVHVMTIRQPSSAPATNEIP